MRAPVAIVPVSLQHPGSILPNICTRNVENYPILYDKLCSLPSYSTPEHQAIWTVLIALIIRTVGGSTE